MERVVYQIIKDNCGLCPYVRYRAQDLRYSRDMWLCVYNPCNQFIVADDDFVNCYGWPAISDWCQLPKAQESVPRNLDMEMEPYEP